MTQNVTTEIDIGITPFPKTMLTVNSTTILYAKQDSNRLRKYYLRPLSQYNIKTDFALNITGAVDSNNIAMIRYGGAYDQNGQEINNMMDGFQIFER